MEIVDLPNLKMVIFQFAKLVYQSVNVANLIPYLILRVHPCSMVFFEFIIEFASSYPSTARVDHVISYQLHSWEITELNLAGRRSPNEMELLMGQFLLLSGYLI